MKKLFKKQEIDIFLKENKYIFNKKYKPLKKIDKGSFCNIYSVLRLKDNCKFAMKIEKINSPQKTLESEAFYLYTLQGGVGIPKLISYGHTKKYNILIETLLDKSLFNIFIKKEKECSLQEMCLIGMQILDRLEWIHSKDIIYRDVKPENFLIGINDPNVIYVVDFGLCKKYRSSKTGKHILPKMTGKFSGTLIYASTNVLRGKEPSRRDDLISLGYMLIYILKRDISWEVSFKDLDRAKYLKFIYFKEKNDHGNLFKDLPNELTEYIKYTRNLKFEQDPDYSYLRSLFNKIILSLNLNFKLLGFSWINPKNKNMLGIPKNTHLRKSTPQNRILKNLKEEINKKLAESSINLSNNKKYPNNKSINNVINSIIINSKKKRDMKFKTLNLNMINKINFGRNESNEINSKNETQENEKILSINDLNNNCNKKIFFSINNIHNLTKTKINFNSFISQNNTINNLSNRNVNSNSSNKKKIDKNIFQKKLDLSKKKIYSRNLNNNFFYKTNMTDNEYLYYNKNKNNIYFDNKNNNKIFYRKIIKNIDNPMYKKISGISKKINYNTNNINCLSSFEDKKKNFYYTKIRSFNENDSEINCLSDIRYKSPLFENGNFLNNNRILEYNLYNENKLNLFNIKNNKEKKIQNNINIIYFKNNYKKNAI